MNIKIKRRKMIKDILFLIRALFKSKPGDHKEVGIGTLKSLPWQGYSWLMWCGVMYCREENYERYIKRDLESTLRHENIHLRQAQECGSWTKYYLKYLWQWIKVLPFLGPYNNFSYYTCPYEVEAYANEDNKTYLDSYNPENLEKKYTFKNRRQVFSEHRITWKTWIKTL